MEVHGNFNGRNKVWFLAWLGDPFVTHSPREFYVSHFHRTDSGLCPYYFTVVQVIIIIIIIIIIIVHQKYFQFFTGPNSKTHDEK